MRRLVGDADPLCIGDLVFGVAAVIENFAAICGPQHERKGIGARDEVVPLRTNVGDDSANGIVGHHAEGFDAEFENEAFHETKDEVEVVRIYLT